MDLLEAVDAVGVVLPKYAIPIHYAFSSVDIDDFKYRCNVLYPNVTMWIEREMLSLKFDDI
jgi:hypothetical protein